MTDDITALVERLTDEAQTRLRVKAKADWNVVDTVVMSCAQWLSVASALTAAQARIEGLENQLVMKRAEAEGIGSLLLDVQQDCIAATNRLAEVEKERDIAENQAVEFGALLRQVEKERDAARAALRGIADEDAQLEGGLGIQRNAMLARARAALSDHPTDGEPGRPGFVLVPREPSEAMTLHPTYIDGEWSRRTWEASMQAALAGGKR